MHECDTIHEGAPEEVAAELVWDTYGPIITCAALEELLRCRRRSVVDWLKEELEPLVRQSTGQESVLARNQSVVAMWRRFEARFDVELGWIQLDASASDGSPFPFSLEGLGYCCVQLTMMLSGTFGCFACRGEHSGPCSSGLLAHLRNSLPWTQGNALYAFPDQNLFSEEQRAAWSLGVSFVSFGLLGRALSSSTVESHAHTLLQQWQWEIRGILAGLGQGAEAPPPYPGS